MRVSLSSSVWKTAKLMSIYVKAHNGGFVCPTPVVLIEEHLMTHFRSRFIHLGSYRKHIYQRKKGIKVNFLKNYGLITRLPRFLKNFIKFGKKKIASCTDEMYVFNVVRSVVY